MLAWDRYAYVNNNPVNGTDPTGMWMCGDLYDQACAENIKEHAEFLAMEAYVYETIDKYTYVGVNWKYEPVVLSLSEAFKQAYLDFASNPHIDRYDLNELMEEIASDLNIKKQAALFNQLPRFSLERNAYDTPFYNLGGHDIFTRLSGRKLTDIYPADQKVCFDYLGCYSRSEVNYIAQGMWDAAAGASVGQSKDLAQLWKKTMYLNNASPGTLEMVELGYYFYLALEGHQSK